MRSGACLGHGSDGNGRRPVPVGVTAAAWPDDARRHDAPDDRALGVGRDRDHGMLAGTADGLAGPELLTRSD